MIPNINPITVIRPTADELFDFIKNELLPYGNAVIYKVMRVPSNDGEKYLLRYLVDTKPGEQK